MCHLHLEAVAVNLHDAVKGSLHTSEREIVRLLSKKKVKKNPFTTSSQVKNTLQEVDVSL